MTNKKTLGRPKNKTGTPYKCPCGYESKTNSIRAVITCGRCHRPLVNPNGK